VIKQVLHKVFSVGLAFIVLCSTLSFTIEKHFCGDKLVDVSVFFEAHKCKMEFLELKNEEVTKKSCCKDEIDMFKGQDELITNTFEDLNFKQQLFVATFTYSYINHFEGLPQMVVPNRDYSPPNLIPDIQVLDQVFLI